MVHRAGYRREIERCVGQHGLEERVLLLGRVDEEVLVSLYQHCGALVFPVIDVSGDVEGFGMVALEAAACGRPTVGFDVGGIGDSVCHGKTGFLAPSGDYETMTQVLHELLTGTRSGFVDPSHCLNIRWSLRVQQLRAFFFQQGVNRDDGGGAPSEGMVLETACPSGYPVVARRVPAEGDLEISHEL